VHRTAYPRIDMTGHFPGPRALRLAPWLAVMLCLATVIPVAHAQDAEQQTKRLITMIRGKVRGQDTFGAGIIVGTGSDRLYVATANHVVRQGSDEAQELRAQLLWLRGEWVEAKLLTHADPASDLAVLNVPGLRRLSVPKLAFDVVGDAATLKKRDAVFTIGYPDGREWYARVTPDYVIEATSDSVAFESTYLAQGHSGGALVNDRWDLVGMIRADQPPEGLAIPIDRILEKLRQWGYPVQLTRRADKVAQAPDAETPAKPAPTEPKSPRTTDRLLPSGVLAVAVGHAHACALVASGAAHCWGDNSVGQLGSESQRQSNVPVPVPGGLAFRQITSLGPHVCGLTATGEAYCWGSNRFGQIGSGSKTEIVSTPSLVSGGLSFVVVSAGYAHTCGVTRTQEAYCWGSNRSGELGTGQRGDSVVPVRVAGGLRFRTISAGGGQTCGITTDSLAYCWGGNSSGELGNGSLTDSPVPVPVAGKLSFVVFQVAKDPLLRALQLGVQSIIGAGLGYTCGIVTKGTAYCWGANRSGQLGNGAQADSSTPVQVSRVSRLSSISAGWSHTCGVTMDGTAYCWGANNVGQLGNGSRTSSAVPVAVSGNLPFRVVRMGGKAQFTCGVTTDGVAYCWGDNSIGQLGTGSVEPSLVPVRVTGLPAQ
jgi:alpha-tubulin suppressor-like RCC1 family protein